MTPEETIAVVKRANAAGFPSVAEYAASLEDEDMRLRRGIRNALRDLEVGDHIRVLNAMVTLRAVSE